jgi:hypothetical protein
VRGDVLAEIFAAIFIGTALIFTIRTAFVVGRPRFGWDGLVF